MKRLEAIVRKDRLETIKDAIEEIGVQAITFCKVAGCGQQNGHPKIYEDGEGSIKFMPKVKIEIITLDDKVEPIISIITRLARTGRIGDGKIFIYSC